MAKQRIARWLRVVCLLLVIVWLACAPLSHTHSSLAAMPVVCLLCIAIVLLLLAQRAALDGICALPLRPSLRRVQIQLPPPNLLP
jgi:protein-S-isoprenylcysteine O-methyltransferase Ste14